MTRHPLYSSLPTRSLRRAVVGMSGELKTTLSLFFGVEGTFHLKEEGKKHPNLRRVGFKTLNKKGMVD